MNRVIREAHDGTKFVEVAIDVSDKIVVRDGHEMLVFEFKEVELRTTVFTEEFYKWCKENDFGDYALEQAYKGVQKGLQDAQIMNELMKMVK